MAAMYIYDNRYIPSVDIKNRSECDTLHDHLDFNKKESMLQKPSEYLKNLKVINFSII